ncbi:DUF6174 domain-containing protein [Streptomyces sp. NPDC002896]|uniref:DUF6174 domain-containing protein n=1 Tax=Streptomyces sp. NPDC002896 TaxID=3154438 RepID=UPI0033314ABF
MPAVHIRSHSVPPVVLLGALMCAMAACGTQSSVSGGSAEGARAKSAEALTSWEKPSSYTYTLTSSEGERTLIGAFQVTVRDGRVAEAVGLDESSRRVVKQSPAEVPTIGELLEQLEQARHDEAYRAEAQYADDGHPVRISLDWEENAVDDEAVYVISGYEPNSR